MANLPEDCARPPASFSESVRPTSSRSLKMSRVLTSRASGLGIRASSDIAEGGSPGRNSPSAFSSMRTCVDVPAGIASRKTTGSAAIPAVTETPSQHTTSPPNRNEPSP